MSTKTYLGDAVYFEDQGYTIKLTTNNGVRDTNTIYLDRAVLVQLLWELVRNRGREAVLKMIGGAQ